MAYRPSPRPTFTGPAAIPYRDVTRHVWGEPASGEVFDWIYASTDLLHCLVFGVGPGQQFTHSAEFRTIFGADEVLVVLEGTMAIANPQTGEVHLAETGEAVFFRKDTWHHAFAHGGTALRVLELYAPPPSAGTSGAYARTQPYLERSTYADDAILGRWPGAPVSDTISVLDPRATRWRREGTMLVGVLASTDHITVARLLVDPSALSERRSYGGDALVYGIRGRLMARCFHAETVSVFELDADDAVYVPAGAELELRNVGDAPAEAVLGVAPRYLADQ